MAVLSYFEGTAKRRVRGHFLHIFRLLVCQMFFKGERSGQQAGQFSTRTLLLRSHAVVIAAVCGLALSFPEIYVVWRGAYVAF